MGHSKNSLYGYVWPLLWLLSWLLQTMNEGGPELLQAIIAVLVSDVKLTGLNSQDPCPACLLCERRCCRGLGNGAPYGM